MTDQKTTTVPAIEPESWTRQPEQNPVDAATYDIRAHNALPGVDVRGSYPHRPVA